MRASSWASISEFSAEQFAALRLQARAWFTIVRPDGCVPPTNYPNGSDVAPYYGSGTRITVATNCWFA